MLLKIEILLIPLLANSHIFKISEDDHPRLMTHARDHWWTLDFANASLFPGINSRAELVSSHRANARNGAETTTTDVGETKEYIDMTAGTFKVRYANYKKSINSPRYSNETEFSKYVWKLKQSNRPYTIKWSVLSHASPYRAGPNSCNRCLEEKFYLMKSHKNRTLNKRTELFSKCRHRNSFSGRNFKRRRAWCNRVSGPLN
jgi:hypothetical protein